MIKNTILEFGKLYVKMRDESFKLIKKIKPKIREIADAQIVQLLEEKNDFYWKHDLPTLKILSKKYKIDTSKLDNFLEKYLVLEKDLLKTKKYFKQIGLKDIDFGPKSISALDKKGFQVHMLIDLKKKDLVVYVNSENKEDKEYANKLKNKVLDLL